MLYDLNIPWSSTTSAADLQRTLSFLAECKSNPRLWKPLLTMNCVVNYSVIALNHSITGAIPSQVINPIPANIELPPPSTLTLLRRCTLTISDPSLNHRLPALTAAYDILALRPITEKAFQAACTGGSEHSLISLDLSIRYPFHFRPKPFLTAIKRGVRFEICYGQATQGDSNARRNFISNVLSIVRATSGRGLVVSSEARSVLGVRAPADVMNLLGVWGVGGERASESLGVNPRAVAVNEGIKRRGFRGIIDVVEGGERPTEITAAKEKAAKGNAQKVEGSANGSGKNAKRKTEDRESENPGPGAEETPQISKRCLDSRKAHHFTHRRQNRNPRQTQGPRKWIIKIPSN
jgi:ribonuclease P/MRP protein subunit RPP1